jgi:hypothetical protein
MSKNISADDESQNKGGRYPKYNAEFFTMKGNRSDELAILKMEFGPDGIDFYVSVFETLCEQDFFIYEFQNKYKLQLLAKKKEIPQERFLEILQFCVEELALFNEGLYKKGFIFSEAFLNQFDSAGLFKNRTMSAEDVRSRVKELLGEVNMKLVEGNQNSGSVKSPIVKNTIGNSSTEKGKEKKEKNNKEPEMERDKKESLYDKDKNPSEKKDSDTEDDEFELPF